MTSLFFRSFLTPLSSLPALPPPQPRRRLELLNVEQPPPTHDQLHLPQLADILRRFAVDDNQIRNLALLDRPVVLVVLHHPRRRDRGHLENKRGGEAGPLIYLELRVVRRTDAVVCSRHHRDL